MLAPLLLASALAALPPGAVPDASAAELQGRLGVQAQGSSPDLAAPAAGVEGEQGSLPEPGEKAGSAVGALGGIPDPVWPPPGFRTGGDKEDGEAKALLSFRRMLLPGTVLLLLGCVALFLSGRKGRGAGQLRVIESVALGPKRNLVIAQVGDEQLILGCSEAGISLLSSRPAPLPPHEPQEPYGSDGEEVRSRAVDRYAEVAAGGAAPPSHFDELLAESAEDQELRRRLAEGLRGRVR